MSLPWDAGLQWRTALVSAETDFLAVDREFIAHRVLRVYTEDVESDLIDHYIRAATAFVERRRGEHIAPKTLTLTADGFPTGAFEFVDGPVREVESVVYLDGEGTETTFDNVSPHTWIFVPAGRVRRATLQPAYGEAWPVARAQPDAVVVTFTVGSATPEEIPDDVQHEIGLTVGEFYTHPDLSNADGQVENILGLAAFYPRRWSNGL